MKKSDIPWISSQTGIWNLIRVYLQVINCQGMYIFYYVYIYTYLIHNVKYTHFYKSREPGKFWKKISEFRDSHLEPRLKTLIALFPIFCNCRYAINGGRLSAGEFDILHFYNLWVVKVTHWSLVLYQTYIAEAIYFFSTLPPLLPPPLLCMYVYCVASCAIFLTLWLYE